MASGTDSQGNSGQAAIDRFAAMMIERMQQMKDTGWKQGWIGGASGYAGLPQNVGGRNYSGSNSFFLHRLYREFCNLTGDLRNFSSCLVHTSPL